MLDNKALARGQKTVIRYFTRDDVEAWSSWPRHTDPLFQDYNVPALSPTARDLWFAERCARGDHLMFAIVTLDDYLVGRIFLRQIDRLHRSAVLGIDLRSDCLDKGYGTDSLSAFIDYYMRNLGYNVLKLDVAAFNKRAQTVYEKLGFEYVGEHWSTYPSNILPGLARSPEYEDIRAFFRHGPGVLSILHYDMMLTADRWRTAHS